MTIYSQIYLKVFQVRDQNPLLETFISTTNQAKAILSQFMFQTDCSGEQKGSIDNSWQPIGETSDDQNHQQHDYINKSSEILQESKKPLQSKKELCTTLIKKLQSTTLTGGRNSGVPTQPQTILHVNGIHLSKTNGLLGLCRLLGSFGDIQRAVFNTVKNYALVQFTSHEAASLCIELLDGLDLGGDDMMCITYWKKLSLNNLKGSQSTYLNYMGDKNDDTSNWKNTPFCYALSQDISIELCGEENFHIQEQYVESVIFDKLMHLKIHAKVFKHKSDSSSWICSFNNFEEAALALMHMHGLIVGHKSLHARMHMQ